MSIAKYVILRLFRLLFALTTTLNVKEVALLAVYKTERLIVKEVIMY